MAPRIVMMDSALSAAEIARELAPAGMELVIAPFGSPEFKAAAPGADFLVGFGNKAIDAGFFATAPKLKLFQLLSAGYDTVDIEAARGAGIPVCNNGGANSTAVAEHALMLMLATCRRLVWQHENVVAGRWRGNNPGSTKLFELRDKVLGIVGLGAIGKKVARLANAFGMTVHYYDIRRVSEAEEDALDVRFKLLGEILRNADIVSLHVPLTPASKHMIGAAELAQMKPTAYRHQHLPRPGDRRGGADRGARIRRHRRRRPRCLRPGAASGRQPAVQAAERHPDPAFRRPHLGQPAGPLPQRLRQLPAGGARREAALDHPRAGVNAGAGRTAGARLLSPRRRRSAGSARPAPGCRGAWSAPPSGRSAPASCRGLRPAACR